MRRPDQEAVVVDLDGQNSPVTGVVVGALFECDNCRMPSLGICVFGGLRQDLSNAEWMILLENSDDIEWYPPRGQGREFSDVPGHIAGAASEAYQCHSIGSHRSSILMARAVIEATAKHLGITAGSLLGKIDKMRETGVVRALIAEAAHGVRELGNDMAHGDFVEPIEREDAALVLTLMSAVLEDAFQIPGKVASAQAAARSRKQARESTGFGHSPPNGPRN